MSYHRKYSLAFIFCLFLISTTCVKAYQEPVWLSAIPEKLKKTGRNNLSKRMHLLFKHFMVQSLRGKGKKDFATVSKKTKNNIFWKGSRRTNIYLDAFQRSYPSIKRYRLRADIPEIVLLIPYLESLWHSHSGKRSEDYGYWQLVLPIVVEIQKLSTSPTEIKKLSPDKIRSHPRLSTKVALLHLRRYYFYFAKVADYNETDAWMFAMLSYNWGAGNVKRLLATMKRKGIKTNFSNFYHYLYQKQRKHKGNLSLKAAVEYLPSLWNIAQVIRYK